jgi:hypothetical protein
MAKAKNKTTKNDASVAAFLNGIEDEKRRKDTKAVKAMMQRVTGKKPKMWGTSIIGFDDYHYKYASGREGDHLITGVSPRKQALTVYIMPGFRKYGALMKRLGKFKTGSSCLYIKKLEDVDMDVLEELVSRSVEYMRENYPRATG